MTGFVREVRGMAGENIFLTARVPVPPGAALDYGLDVAHLPRMQEVFQDAIRTVAPYLDPVHLGNCVLAGLQVRIVESAGSAPLRADDSVKP